MQSIRTILCWAVSIFSINAWSADIYVATNGSDSNPGTQSSPFRTIQKAASVAKAGTTIHVAPGTYTESITSANSGTASARIRFVSTKKWGAKIMSDNRSKYIWLVSGGYTDIDGFQIDGTGGTKVREGIYLIGGNSNVLNSWIHHVAENSGCDNGGGAAVVADQSRGKDKNNYHFIGNLVHDIGGGCEFIQGLYHSSSGSIKNNIVYNTVHAIHLYHDDHDIEVANNTVFNNSAWGIVYGGCKEAYNNGCPTSGIHIHNNIVFDNWGGIQGPISSEDVNNSIKNNLVFGNSRAFDISSRTAITGTISADPQFVDYRRTGGGDYRLKSTSPAIDKGLSTYAPKTDFEGNKRPQGAAVDIGAYEFGSTVTPTPEPTPKPEPQPQPEPVGKPIASFSSKSLNFGSIIMGTKSTIQYITVTNTGTAELIFNNDKVSISGEFEFGNKGTCGDKLAVGEKCTFSALFAPRSAGTKSGALTVSTNASSSLVSISLSGTGLSKTTPAPEPTPEPEPTPVKAPVASYSAKSINFGSVSVGSSSSVQFITVTNTGSAELIFKNDLVSINGEFEFGNLGTCGETLAVGEKCTFSAKFTPKSSGTKTGSMVVSTNASSGTVNISLTGVGVSAGDTKAPVTSITSPTNGSTVKARSNVTIRASASDNVGIKSVEFYVNGSLVCRDTSSPYRCTWTVPRQRGVTYTLETKAYDAAGNVGVSNKIRVRSK